MGSGGRAGAIGGLVAGAIVSFAAVAARAEGWDDVARGAAGGTYSTACADGRAPRLTLGGAGLLAQRGAARIEALSLDVSYSWFGQQVPADFRMAVIARWPRDGELTLLLFQDAGGRYVTLAGDKETLATLGDRGDGRVRYRDCDAARRGADGAAAASRQREEAADERAAARASPLADPRFAGAYRRALGTRARVPWLARMDGPSQGPQPAVVAGRHVTQYAFCKPHDCYDNNVLLLYEPVDATLVGVLLETGRPMTLLGGPSPPMAAELGRRWRSEFRQAR